MLSEPQSRPRAPGTGRIPRLYLLFIGDFAISLACYVLAASVLEGEFDLYWLSVNENAWRFLLVAILSLQGSLLMQGLYSQPRTRSRIELLLCLAQALGVSLLVGSVLVYWQPTWRLPVGVVVLGGAMNIAALFAWRMLFAALFWGTGRFCRILFVGVSPSVVELAGYLTRRPEVGYSVVGFLDDSPEPGATIAGAKVLGPLTSVAEHVTRTRPDRVVVGMADPRGRLPVRALLDMKSAGVIIQEVSEFYEAVFGRICSAELRPSRLIFLGDFSARPGGMALQSIYMNLLTLVAIVLLAPLIVLISIAIKLSSRGPALERQTCVGFESLPFSRFTFRCTVIEKTGKNPASAERRYTLLGRWLRRWHLHKLPELLNVLRGEMSLVGPRPHRVEFSEPLARLYPFYNQRHLTKPGITGWAQINLKGEPGTVDERIALEYDIYYIKHLSPTLDLYILLHSPW